ncbi:hypothetical protein OEA41_002328 [Lepraria neglecta]|uniref:BTB domain-containing protein n=1 Tax=Lepraria neglecta TaxID=209136 RepID=A0AAE0DMC0_9LECA|nr:hypothetical protein OEA41_002328 [Lepraria neglecta]
MTCRGPGSCQRISWLTAHVAGSLNNIMFKKVKLPEFDNTGFELFVQWLYKGSISGPSWVPPGPYVKAWTLGEKLDCPVFQELAPSQLIEIYHYGLLELDALGLVYQGLSVGSSIRQWIVDQYVFEAYSNRFDDNADALASTTKDLPEFAGLS